MEFFLPSLAALLIAALIVFLIIPRLGAPVLAALSIALLVYGVYNHIQLFSAEYRYSTWQDRLKFYAPFVMIGGLIIAILFYLTYIFGTQGAAALPASNIPVNDSVNKAVNSITEVAENAAATVGNTVTDLTNAVGLTTVNKNVASNQGLLSNLGGILNTPTIANNRRNNRAPF
jgi:hypothetical protein